MLSIITVTGPSQPCSKQASSITLELRGAIVKIEDLQRHKDLPSKQDPDILDLRGSACLAKR